MIDEHVYFRFIDRILFATFSSFVRRQDRCKVQSRARWLALTDGHLWFVNNFCWKKWLSRDGHCHFVSDASDYKRSHFICCKYAITFINANLDRQLFIYVRLHTICLRWMKWSIFIWWLTRVHSTLKRDWDVLAPKHTPSLIFVSHQTWYKIPLSAPRKLMSAQWLFDTYVWSSIFDFFLLLGFNFALNFI